MELNESIRSEPTVKWVAAEMYFLDNGEIIGRILATGSEQQVDAFVMSLSGKPISTYTPKHRPDRKIVDAYFQSIAVNGKSKIFSQTPIKHLEN